MLTRHLSVAPATRRFICDMCNKLASRHVRVGLASPSDVPRCEPVTYVKVLLIDGSSFCLQCDMTVHVNGKRTHGRYLLLRPRVEFLGDKPGRLDELALQTIDPNKGGNRLNHLRSPQERISKIKVSPLSTMDAKADGDGKVNSKSFDLIARTQQCPGLNNEGQGMDGLSSSNHESAGVVPVGSFEREPEK